MAKTHTGARLRKLPNKGEWYQLYWWCPVAKRIRTKSTRTKDYKLALEILEKFNKKTGKQYKAPVRVNEVLVNYIEKHLSNIPDKKNAKKYSIDTHRIMKSFENIYVNEINTDLVKSRIKVREQRLLKAALNYAEKHSKLINHAPYFKLDPPHDPRQIVLQTQEDIDQFVRTASEDNQNRHTYLFILIALETGQRKTAIQQLQWKPNSWAGHVDFKRNEINFNGQKKFGRKPRSHIAIPESLLPVLQSEYANWQYGDQKCPNVIQYNGKAIDNIRKSFTTIAERAGYPEIKPHDLRRTAITHAVRRGDNTSDTICDYFNISIETYRKHYAVHEPHSVKFKAGLTTALKTSTVSNTVSQFPRTPNNRNKNNRL